MASKKKNDLKITEQLKDVSPWTERIGVYIIGLMTTVGLALIMYTGVRAATYAPAEVTELLSHADIVRGTDSDHNEDESNDEVLDNEDETENDSVEDIDIAEDGDSADEDESNEDNGLPTSFVGAAIGDMVFVREEPRTGESSAIHTYLSEGDEVKVINSNYNENWMQVEIDGIIAYVGKGLLVPVE